MTNETVQAEEPGKPAPKRAISRTKASEERSYSKAASVQAIGHAMPAVRDFLAELFEGEEPKSVHVVSVAGDPNLEKSWYGGRLGAGYSLRPDDNLFWCVGLLAPDVPGRSVSNVVKHIAIALDDVGTKVPLEKVDALRMLGIAPTAVVETSPGNFQYVYKLDRPVDETPGAISEAGQVLLAVRQALKVGDWGDAACFDPVRYLRLPGGINGKAKYAALNGGTAPRVLLRELTPGQTVALETWAEMLLGSDWKQKALSGAYVPSHAVGALGGDRNASMDDPLVKLAAEVGLNPRPSGRAGVIDCDCPNGHNHTDGNLDGYAFINDGRSYCNHGHCQGLTSADFEDLIKEKFRVQVALGSSSAFERPEDFLAHARFEGLGAFEASGLAAVRAEIDAAPQAAAPRERSAASGRGIHLTALSMLVDTGAEYFPDAAGRTWIKIDGRNYCLDSEAGQRRVVGWLSERDLDLVGTARHNLVETIQARACAKPAREVYRRQAGGGDLNAPEAFINLMDDLGRAVHVHNATWTVENLGDLPVEMADRQGARPLPQPVRAKDGVSFLDRLGRHIKLAGQLASVSTDTGIQQRAAWVMAFLSQFYRPGGVPHVYLSGSEGAGKTTLAMRFKALTDPDSAPITDTPKVAEDMFVIAGEQTNLVLDNQETLPSGLAKTLSVLATGTASQGRRYYTNGDRYIIQAKTTVVITTVEDDLVRRPDLLQRVLTVKAVRLDPSVRRTAEELQANWDRDAPALFADLMDLLAGALKLLPSVAADVASGKLPPPPRLIDAAVLAEAACQFLGWPPGLCLSALNEIQNAARQDQLDQDPVAQRLAAFLTQRGGSWSGTVSELLTALECMQGQPRWENPPRTDRALGMILSRMSESLRTTLGIDYQKNPRTKARRVVTLSMGASAASPQAGSSPIAPSSPGNINGIRRLSGDDKGDGAERQTPPVAAPPGPPASPQWSGTALPSLE